MGKVTDKVFFDITIGGKPKGRIVFGLFGDVAPMTVGNFVALAKGDHHSGLRYKGTQFWRIMPSFMAQGGDVTKDDGTGGKSIYGTAFRDESFEIPLNKKYQLAMANNGRDTNKSQFMITFKALSWLNGKHVVFGEVIEGKSVVDQIEKQGTWGSGKPKSKVVIADCGELPMEGEEAMVAGQGCDDSCIKFAAEWIGDGVCDHDSCAGCPGWTKNGVFDQGDCGTSAMKAAYQSVAMAHEQTTSVVSLVHVMAAIGFAFTAYGAFRHYVK